MAQDLPQVLVFEHLEDSQQRNGSQEDLQDTGMQMTIGLNVGVTGQRSAALGRMGGLPRPY